MNVEVVRWEEKRFVGVLENYGFSGMDASQLGAIKSVADYYGIPVSPSGNKLQAHW